MGGWVGRSVVQIVSHGVRVCIAENNFLQMGLNYVFTDIPCSMQS